MSEKQKEKGHLPWAHCSLDFIEQKSLTETERKETLKYEEEEKKAAELSPEETSCFWKFRLEQERMQTVLQVNEEKARCVLALQEEKKMQLKK